MQKVKADTSLLFSIHRQEATEPEIKVDAESSRQHEQEQGFMPNV